MICGPARRDDTHESSIWPKVGYENSHEFFLVHSYHSASQSAPVLSSYAILHHIPYLAIVVFSRFDTSGLLVLYASLVVRVKFILLIVARVLACVIGTSEWRRVRKNRVKHRMGQTRPE
jgi:hypothetical protein